MSRVSVSLTKRLEQAVAESGRKIPELIELGLEYLAEKSDKISEADRLGSMNYPPHPPGHEGNYANPSWGKPRPTADDCKHPAARRSKGGLCMACGTNVG